jgi:hypothetical protein
MKTRPEAVFLHGRLCAGGCGLASLIVRRLRISATKETEELDDHFMIEKQYSFTQDSEVIGEETLNLGFYRQNAMDEILGKPASSSSASTTTGSSSCTRTAARARRRARKPSPDDGITGLSCITRCQNIKCPGD